MCLTILTYGNNNKEGATSDTLKTTDLNTVVVTANKTRINRNNVPLTISVITKEDIEISGHSALLPVLSELVPGLFVTQKGMIGFGVSEGSAGAVNIRGVGQGNKVLMLLDGQPQFAGLFGHSLPDLYVSSDVERVEVIRGAGSLLYGSNAMGGVVNVITRQMEKEGMETRLRTSYGSYNTQKYQINNGYSSGNLSTFFSVNHDRTDGHRRNSKFNITNGYAKVKYRAGNHFNIIADVSIADIYNENPGRTTDPLYENRMDIFRGSASVAVENNHKFGSGAVKGFYNKGSHRINDGYMLNQQPRDYLFNSTDHNYGIMAYESFRFFPGNSFTIGFDYKNWGGEAWNSDISTGNKNHIIDKNVDETAGYFIVQQDFFDALTLNGGVRFEYNSEFEGELIPQIGATLRAFPGNVLKVSISKGYRSPSIREMFMFPPQNPDLLPENMINYELSVGQTMFNSRLTTEINLFYIDGWNMIEVVRINGIPKNLNTGFFENRGFELQASYRVKHNLRADVNYSFLNTSKPILASPKNHLFAGIVYSPEDFMFNLVAQHIGGMYINTATKAQVNYTLINFRGSYKTDILGLKTRFFINADNITGTSYSINEGFPMPGATFMGGFDIFF